MTDALTVVRRRRRILEYLCEGAAPKRDIVATTESSRSTVNRAVSELSSLGLVERVDGGFRTTTPGRLSLDVVTETSETIRTIRESSDVLSNVPLESHVSHRFLVGAHVVTGDSAAPYSGVDDAFDRLRRADRVRGFGIADNDPRWTRILHERATDGSMTVSVAVTRRMAEYVLDRYDDKVEEYLAADDYRIRVCESLPFEMFLFDIEGRTVAHLLVVDETGSFVGQVENDRPDAVAWAEARFAERFEAGVPISELLG
ncbi:helix-turn-helix transcriptional regulator [Halopelagius fulvigenes]|uniref:Helix-turn-helix transcriptional regulator n=1 Tax=Halopelagius fulvigenes TaxID=1198324 RepID=A0ABD5TVX3_9EURY